MWVFFSNFHRAGGISEGKRKLWIDTLATVACASMETLKSQQSLLQTRCVLSALDPFIGSDQCEGTIVINIILGRWLDIFSV